MQYEIFIVQCFFLAFYLAFFLRQFKLMKVNWWNSTSKLVNWYKLAQSNLLRQFTGFNVKTWWINVGELTYFDNCSEIILKLL
jgi:hypothetical protein